MNRLLLGLMGCLTVVGAQALVIQSPVNQTPANEAIQVSTTPTLTATPLNANDVGPISPQLLQSEWLVYSQTDVSFSSDDKPLVFLGGRVDSNGQFLTSAPTDVQIIEPGFLFKVDGVTVNAIGVSPVGILTFYDNKNDLNKLAEADFFFSNDVQPQSMDALVAYRESGSAGLFEWQLKSASGNWSKKLQIRALSISGSYYLWFYIESPTLSQAFFDADYDSTIGVRTLGNNGVDSRRTMSAWKSWLISEDKSQFALSCRLLGSGCLLGTQASTSLEPMRVDFQRKFVGNSNTYTPSVSEALPRNHTLNWQVRYQASNAQDTVTSNWSTATGFQTELSNRYALAASVPTALKAGTEMDLRWSVDHVEGDPGQEVHLTLALPFAVPQTAIDDGSVSMLLGGTGCSAALDQAQTIFQCVRKDTFAIDSQTELLVKWTYPESTTDQTYVITYKVCEALLCATTNAQTVSVPVAGAIPPDNNSEGSNGGGAVWWLWLIVGLGMRGYPLRRWGF